jgi:hypothetical protein
MWPSHPPAPSGPPDILRAGGIDCVPRSACDACGAPMGTSKGVAAAAAAAVAPPPPPGAGPAPNGRGARLDLPRRPESPFIGASTPRTTR